MRSLSDREILTHLRNIIQEVRKVLPVERRKEITLETIDEACCAFIHLGDESRKSMKRDFGKYFDLCQVGISATTILGFLFYDCNRSHNPLPPTLISNDGKPDPNEVIQSLLISVANHSGGILQLCKSGFEESARVVLRTLSEEVWLTIVLLYDHNRLRLYSRNLEEKERKRIWRKHFHPTDLDRLLHALEGEVGLPEGIVQEVSHSRRESYDLYSSSAHGHTLSTLLGKYTDPPNEAGRLVPNFFGMAGIRSCGSLISLSWINLSLVLYVTHLIHRTPSFSLPWEDRLWPVFVALHKAHEGAHLAMAREYEAEEKDRELRDQGE